MGEGGGDSVSQKLHNLKGAGQMYKSTAKEGIFEKFRVDSIAYHLFRCFSVGHT